MAYTYTLPHQLYTCAQTRALDAAAIKEDGVSGFELMSRAGREAFQLMRNTWPNADNIIVACGAGNNAGDGYLLAVLAREAGLNVQIYALKEPLSLTGDALTAAKKAIENQIPIQQSDAGSWGLNDQHNIVIVDALLGTGASGVLRDNYKEAITWINQALAPIFSLDIPSGLCGDTGKSLGAAVNARQTITFIGVKQGLLTAEGVDKTGALAFSDLGVSQAVYERFNQNQNVKKRGSYASCHNMLPVRKPSDHKGTKGRLLLIGGDTGFGGAIIMAAEAAARAGSGLTHVATRQMNTMPLLARTPEVMAKPVDAVSDLEPMLANQNCIAVGPGLGQSAWSQQLLLRVLQTDIPLVVDADALNLLSKKREEEWRALPLKREDWVLTPHPGEAARLLDCTVAEIQSDRFKAAELLYETYGGVIVLKGPGTIVISEKGIDLANVGNPGMASGGMGDILTGIIASLVTQGVSLHNAATLGVILHGEAADLVAKEFGMNGMLATDLIPMLRQLMNLR